MLGGGEPQAPTSSLSSCSQALLLSRSKTLGAQGGQSTHTWWTRTPPPSTLPGARRARRTRSSSSRKQQAYGTSLRDPPPRSEKPLKGAGGRALLCQLPGAWAGTEGTQRCARTRVVTSPSFVPLCHACPVDAVSRCGDPVGSLPACRGGWPDRAGPAHGHTTIPPAATPRASAAPHRAVREHSDAPSSSTSTFGGINGLLYPSGPQHLPIACTFPGVSLSPFLVWTSGDPISSPCFCRAWLFYLCVGGGIILIKAVIFLHMLAVLSVERVCPILHFPERQDGLVQPQ